MSEQKTINDSLEFIKFVSDNSLSEAMLKEFDAAWKNMIQMKLSLSKRPCSCGGVNPDAVLAQRKVNLDNFYRDFIYGLPDEPQKLNNFMNIMPRNVVFKLDGTEILKV